MIYAEVHASRFGCKVVHGCSLCGMDVLACFEQDGFEQRGRVGDIAYLRMRMLFCAVWYA